MTFLDTSELVGAVLVEVGEWMPIMALSAAGCDGSLGR